MEAVPIARLLKPPEMSFFLFGPRGTGKSTWLNTVLPGAHRFDLLKHGVYMELSNNPSRLEAMVGAAPKGTWVVLDEIQKAPHLLDEVHRLMQSNGWRFALCGSSARKLRRAGVNLLAGRAITLNMEPFSAAELGAAFDLQAALTRGLLPVVHAENRYAAEVLGSYVDTYLREEVREEGLVRNVAPFVRFLEIAGRLNGQELNAANVSRDAAVSRSSVDAYFSILTDTLVGHFLPPYQPGFKVRERSHSKFYWFDQGVARAAAGLAGETPDRSWLGFALETLVFHELRVFNEVSGKRRGIFFYRTRAGSEIDFVVETAKRQKASRSKVVCIETKLSGAWDRRWEFQMRDMKVRGAVEVVKMLGVYTGDRRYHFDGLDVLPVADFLKTLHSGEVF
ncbi:MAG: ATP-binding protein [Deltaproteobacteria bacterium]|nr:ATP-binding protein [Deltaproteobacteria bacterium]